MNVDIITSGAKAITGLSNSIFGGLDELITNDEERMKVKAMIQLQLQQFETAMQGELTSRHAADMASDNKLSKNIRPGALALFSISFVAAVFAPNYIDNERLRMMYQLLMLVAGFYFGGRSIEKSALGIFDKVIKSKKVEKE